MRNKLILTLLGLLATATSASAAPITVQSVLFDYDQNALTVGPPTTNTTGTTITNGDFRIELPPGSDHLTIGDGVDEWTKALFDFTGDTNYRAFSNLLTIPHGKIMGATLRLTLTPEDPLYVNDQINLENQAFVGEPLIGNQLTNNPYLSNGISKEVTINLLDFYSQQQLASFFSDGTILLTYADDSIVSGASLTLTANIPEPGSIALLSGGLGLLWKTRRRNRT